VKNALIDPVTLTFNLEN